MLDQGNKALAPGPLETAGQNRFAAGRFGTLWLAWIPEGLVMIELSGEPPAPEARRRWLPELEEIPELAVPRAIYETLSRYFDGEPVDPATLPVRFGGTKFQRRAWTALRAVPRGEVRTYAGLATDIRSPRAMRAVGLAMGANPIPIVVPCHRCVGHGYTLGGYSGGVDKKRFLLELEGVVVDGDHVHPGQLELL